MSRFPLPTPTLVSTWRIPGDENGFNAGINCPVEERKLKIRVSSNVLCDLHTHSKMFAKVQEEKYVLLAVDYPCTPCYYIFPVSQFGSSTRRDRFVDDYLYSLHLSASQRTPIIKRI